MRQNNQTHITANMSHWYENERLESLGVSSNVNKNSSQTIISYSFQTTISSMAFSSFKMEGWVECVKYLASFCRRDGFENHVLNFFFIL